MQIGTSLILIAIGAILRFAVTESVSGIDLQVVGLILMVIGVVGLVLSVFLMTRTSTDRVVHEQRRDPPLR